MNNVELLDALSKGGLPKQASKVFKGVSEAYSPGQELASTNVTLGGQYGVAVEPTPKTNSALQFANALNKGVEVYGQVVDLTQQKAAEKVAEMTDEEFESAYSELLKQGGETDPNLFSKVLGRDKQYQVSMVDRWFRDVAPTEVDGLKKSLESEIQNFKTTAEYDEYVASAVDDYFAQKSVQFSNGTHAQNAYNIKAAGSSAKMKIALDDMYEKEAEASIYDNQQEAFKTIINDKLLTDGTNADSRSATLTDAYQNALNAFDGDKALANKLLKETVSGEITELISKGGTANLDKADEIFNSLFNEELSVGGKTDIFDDPKLEFELRRGIQEAETRAINDEQKEASQLVPSVIAPLFVARNEGNLASAIEDGRNDLIKKRDAGSISDRAFSAGMEAIDAFKADPELAQRNAIKTANNTAYRETRALDSFQRTLGAFTDGVMTEFELTPDKLLSIGYARIDDTNQLEAVEGKFGLLQDKYIKAYTSLVSKRISLLDVMNLPLDRRVESLQDIHSAGRQAGIRIISYEIEGSKERVKKVTDSKKEIAEAVNRGLSNTVIEFGSKKFVDDPEALKAFYAGQTVEDTSDLLTENGEFTSKYLAGLGDRLSPQNVGLTVPTYTTELEGGNINAQQYRGSIEKLTTAVDAYEPESTTLTSSMVLDKGDQLSLVGISVEDLKKGSVTLKYATNLDLDVYSYGLSIESRPKSQEVTLDQIQLNHYTETNDYIEIGKNIPIRLNGSMLGTLNAIQKGDVDAFDEAASLLDITPQKAYNNHLEYFKAIKQLPSTFKQPAFTQPTSEETPR